MIIMFIKTSDNLYVYSIINTLYIMIFYSFAPLAAKKLTRIPKLAAYNLKHNTLSDRR